MIGAARNLEERRNTWERPGSGARPCAHAKDPRWSLCSRRGLLGSIPMTASFGLVGRGCNDDGASKQGATIRVTEPPCSITKLDSQAIFAGFGPFEEHGSWLGRRGLGAEQPFELTRELRVRSATFRRLEASPRGGEIALCARSERAHERCENDA
jgi:hypothetical protein